MRPKIGLALEAGLETARPEPAVRLLAGKHGIDPFAGRLDDRFVLQHVTEIAVALEPVGQFFPAAVPLPLRISPGIAFELAPLGDLRQPPGHSLRFEFELMPQPTFGGDIADRQFDEWTWHKWLTVGGIEGAPRCGRRINHFHVHGFSHGQELIR